MVRALIQGFVTRLSVMPMLLVLVNRQEKNVELIHDALTIVIALKQLFLAQVHQIILTQASLARTMVPSHQARILLYPRYTLFPVLELADIPNMLPSVT